MTSQQGGKNCGLWPYSQDGMITNTVTIFACAILFSSKLTSLAFNMFRETTNKTSPYRPYMGTKQQKRYKKCHMYKCLFSPYLVYSRSALPVHTPVLFEQCQYNTFTYILYTVTKTGIKREIRNGSF